MAAKQAIQCLAAIVLISLLVLQLQLLAMALRRLKSLNTIADLNQRGSFLGLITTYPPEEKAFFAIGAFEPDPRHPFVDLTSKLIYILLLLQVDS